MLSSTLTLSLQISSICRRAKIILHLCSELCKCIKIIMEVNVPPVSELAPPRKNIGDGVLALDVECSVSDREPHKLAGLESPEVTPFRPNVGVSGLNV